ncbi:MAG: hypothetical protein V3V08_18935 [Nannocystaceae bacterium]
MLLSDQDYSCLHPTARAALTVRREAFAGLRAGNARKIEMGDDEVRWWTFAGGRVNTTLKYAIEALTPWKVVPDNLVLRIRGENSLGQDFQNLLDQLRAPWLWDDAKLWNNVAGSLPDYRLSKFQDVLPEAAAREMLAAFLLDVERARAICGG